MAITLRSQDWNQVQSGTTRGVGTAVIPGLPPSFVPEDAEIEEIVVEPRAAVRGAVLQPGPLDLTCDLRAGEAAVLAVRHPSGALTFHAPRESVGRTRGGPTEVRFIVAPPVIHDEEASTSRGLLSTAVKAMVVKVAGRVVDSVADWALPKLAERFESMVWKKKGLQEGWCKVTQESLSKGLLEAGTPSSTERALLLIHGTFSHAASAYASLADSSFFRDVEPLYGDRIFAFNHFTISKTPEQNVRMLLEGLPDKNCVFDVITHSRGGLVLRTVVERPTVFGRLAARFTLGRAVLVAAPNEGTPLATPSRWEQTVGWVANLLEMFPDNPFTTGAEFVANGLVWIAKRASGSLPGIHAMDGDGPLIRTLQSPPGPPAEAYSVLAANYHPTDNVLRRVLDMGVDQFFNTANDLVVPSEGGWRVDPTGGTFIPGSRIGCFGPGGNLSRHDVTHVNVFAQPETIQFLVTALHDHPHRLEPIDPAERLPDRRLLRAGAAGLAAPAIAGAGKPAAATRMRGRGRDGAASRRERQEPLRISVMNGDVRFEEQPLLIGHYRATVLTGTEAVLDHVLGQTMSASLALGVYPMEPGTHRIFPNHCAPHKAPWLSPRPRAVIVAGLGQEGKLRSADIIHTVRQAVLAWVEREVERRIPPGAAETTLSLSTALLGSGGTGVTPGQAAQLVADAVYQANESIRRVNKGQTDGATPQEQARRRLPEVRELRVVELYLDRATEAWEALALLAETAPLRYRVMEPIAMGKGSLRGPLQSGYRGANYDYITAESRQDLDGNSFISYSLHTQRARTEVRAQAMQARLLRELIATDSSTPNADQQIGRTLYNLLVPVELEPFLASSGEMQIELDSGTAGIPWELLDDASPGRSPEAMPWAIRSKLLRKFKTETFRAQVTDADGEASILIIGEPQCPPEYPPLPGALKEAQAVYTLLTTTPGIARENVSRLFAEDQSQRGPDSRQVIDALFERSWRIVHIAGHGAPVGEKGNGGGVVLSNDTFLSASEIKAMRVVPELVFVNCCHLAAESRHSLLQEPPRGRFDRSHFASSVARALIDVGVRCVVAAGWAVDDSAASTFATTFYGELLRGQRFLDAVAVARAKTYEYDGNTWAAYQCYGDPEWRLRKAPASAAASSPDEREFDHVGSVPALQLALETLCAQSTYQGYAAEYQLKRMQNLEAHWKKMGWHVSGVAELFASAYKAVGQLPDAIRWYMASVAAGDDSTSFRAFEQLSNLRIRHEYKRAHSAKAERDRVVSGGSGKVSARERAQAAARLRAATQSARTIIKEEMKRLERLSELQDTVERASLRGSAMKHLAMLEADAGRHESARQATLDMVTHYTRSLELAREQKAANLFYPVVNLLVAEIALHAGTTHGKEFPKTLVDEARASAQAQNKIHPDFWSLMAVPELHLYEAVARNTLSRSMAADILRAFKEVIRRSRGASDLDSVSRTMHFAFDRYVERLTGQDKTRVRELMTRLDELFTPPKKGEGPFDKRIKKT
jgi:CHAT domain-containing protein